MTWKELHMLVYLLLTWSRWSAGCELLQPQANLGTARRNLQGMRSSLVKLINFHPDFTSYIRFFFSACLPG
jgi:hypothetical protein